MGTEQGADVLGFTAEYDEPEPEQKPPPRHARPRIYVRRIIALLGTGLLLSVGLCAYLWLKLDDERSGHASMVATNEAFESSLDNTRQQLAETRQSLREANDEVVSGKTDLARLQRQLDTAKKRAANLEDDLDAAESDLDESRAEVDTLEANIQQSIELLNSCANSTAQVAAILEAGRFDREFVAHYARQAAGLCAAAAESLPSP